MIGFDDIHLCQIVSPPLTTVRQPFEALMKSAVGLLIGRMEEKSRTAPEHLTFTPELVVRESTAQAAVR